MPDRGNGMGHQRAYPAAAGGKRPGNNHQTRNHPTSLTPDTPVVLKRLIFALFALVAASVSSSASYAQSGPFTGMAGSWSGGGTVTLDDGSTERIRCRATYAVGAGGNGLNQTLVCASDSYKFDLKSNVIADR